MSRVHELTIEPLTDDAFAPFGELVAPKDRAPDFATASGTRGWAIDFRSGRPLVMLLQTPYAAARFSKLERHFNVTQTFFPLGGAPAVVAVAPGSPDRAAIPHPSEVRAFLLDGSRGYALARGTWHSLDRYPLSPPDTRWVILTDHETQDDLAPPHAGPDGTRLTQEVDYAERFGVTFVLATGR